jgi:hypothetical protein
VREAEHVRRSRPQQVLDIMHGDFHRDPMGVVERIYRFIGEELSPATRAAMQQRIIDDPERQHGSHRYNVADFGLTEEEIRERFGSYIEQFDLAPRRSAHVSVSTGEAP